jgi:hypothetical protein
MHSLKSVAPKYDPGEDRVLLAINAGREDAWSCWLTRRMALGALDRLNQYLNQTSAITARTPLEYRTEVAAMERQAAVARMQKSISSLPKKQLVTAAASGELATGLRLKPQAKGFLLEISGREGGQARGLVSRAELQTILLLIEQEASKAGWLPVAPQPPTQELERQEAPPVGKKRTVN